MKKILILGASSDIGIELTKYFLVRNYKVVAHLNKNSKDLNKLNNKNLKLFKFDLIKIKEFERFVNKIEKLNYMIVKSSLGSKQEKSTCGLPALLLIKNERF